MPWQHLITMVIDKICKMTVKGVKLKSESFFSISSGVLGVKGQPFYTKKALGIYSSYIITLRCSAHRLKIEIGRYSRFYSEETKRHEQLPRERRTCDTCKDKVENEHHFLLECSLNEEIRKNFFQKLYIIMTEDIQLWSDTDKIKYFLAQQTNLL